MNFLHYLLKPIFYGLLLTHLYAHATLEQEKAAPQPSITAEKKPKISEKDEKDIETLRLWISSMPAIHELYYWLLRKMPYPLNIKEFQTEIIPLPEETEKKAREIVLEYGLDPNTINIVGRASGTAAAGKTTIYINPKKLSPDQIEQFRFVIGHEAGHIKYHHSLKSFGCSLIAPFVAYIGLTLWDGFVQKTLSWTQKKLNLHPQNSVNSIINKVKFAHSWLAHCCVVRAIAGYTFVYAMSRTFEKNADIESVKRLNCKAGAIAWGKEAQKSNLIRKQKATGLNSLAFSKEGDFRLDFEHPMLSERIRYIEALS